MGEDRFLYWGSGSPPAWRVMITLMEKNLEYTSKQCDFSKKEHKSMEILELNPRGQVPTMVDQGVVVCESGAAVQYLDAVYANPPLMPKDRKALGLALQRFHESNVLAAKISEVFRLKMLGQIKTEEDESAWDKKVAALNEELLLWDAHLSEGYAAGKEFTLADVMLIPYILILLRLDATLETLPNVKKYAETLKARPSVKKTSPPHWATSPSPGWLKGKF
ncbi:hypothetical protein WJX81_006248 [Elliptochloris bilobata]|uniref:Glutathione S-transferase n=1 Tax=Elliptochloris bilobata TaxID=381761 RepID=A0AAW1RF82_9CHLO